MEKVLFLFMIFSTIGWLWETPWVSFRMKKYVNRGFLHGPYIPIYGCAIVTVILSMGIFAFSVFISCNSSENKNTNSENSTNSKLEKGIVYVYNFHTTNRCPTCIAIETLTTKTIKTIQPSTNNTFANLNSCCFLYEINKNNNPTIQSIAVIELYKGKSIQVILINF